MKDLYINTKICNDCEDKKSLDEFRRHSNICMPCINIKQKMNSKTKHGLITKIYCAQRSSSRKRGHDIPAYDLSELREWAFNQTIFHKLFDAWKESGHKKDLRPSFDRTDDYLGYSLDRLKIMTWAENNKKAYEDRKNGINNKKSKAVRQMTLDGRFIVEHYSITQAARCTRAIRENIRACCKGKVKTAGGYKWSYA